MSERLIDKPIPIPSAFVLTNGVKRLFASVTKTDARVAYRHHDFPRIIHLRVDPQHPSSIGDRRHGFETIHDQVQQDLLQLNAISPHQGERVVNCNCGSTRFLWSSCRVTAITS